MAFKFKVERKSRFVPPAELCLIASREITSTKSSVVELQLPDLIISALHLEHVLLCVKKNCCHNSPFPGSLLVLKELSASSKSFFDICKKEFSSFYSRFNSGSSLTSRISAGATGNAFLWHFREFICCFKCPVLPLRPRLIMEWQYLHLAHFCALLYQKCAQTSLRLLKLTSSNSTWKVRRLFSFLLF